MTRFRFLAPLLCAVVLLAGCAATRPVNAPIGFAELGSGYRLENRHQRIPDRENVVVLAFSGGGTRAAAFSYGVLEFLRNTEVEDKAGRRIRLLDQVSLVTGVSGGSFTALAYGLYGERLFDEYEKRFLKRDVQGEITARFLSPGNWPRLLSQSWGRSELAAEYYDEILFGGATFGDLARRDGPMILASATDISSGARFVFNQATFDVICSDLESVPLSRAAAASSAVPVVLSPVTIDNYGGRCARNPAPWVTRFLQTKDPPRPAARAIRALRALEGFSDGARRPFLHLVDGGVSDNVGMRGVLDSFELLESLQEHGEVLPFEKMRRVIVVVVNSLSTPRTDWDRRETPPGTAALLVRSAGVPIDHYSYEAIELLKDTASRWRTMRQLRRSTGVDMARDPRLAASLRTPDTEIYAIDVSFGQLKDPAEIAFLNEQPTSFALSTEAVDRLRAAAGRIIEESPEFQRLLKDLKVTIVEY